ncbi:hypothetical protein JXB41_08305 [Candidatus Woesearchaeota archaeon]|nr:hypothetical protein [Candidatus Woesearchaeota archaeon]
MADEFDLEEISLICGVCGKQVKVVVYKGYDTSDFVCQRCNQGELSSEEEGSDI